VESYYHYDPAKAKQVLDQAGWAPGSDGIRTKNGQRLSMSYAIADFDKPYAETLQAGWKQIGVELQLQQMAVSAIFAAISAGNVNMASIGWVSSDPVILSNLFLSKNIKGGYAWTEYNDPHLDDLLNQGEQTMDETQRATVYAQAQKVIMDQALIIPLDGILKNVAIQSKYKGLKLDFREYQWLYDVNVQ
jgi:peptide/nickel transport system substrate-binding protein